MYARPTFPTHRATTAPAVTPAPRRREAIRPAGEVFRTPAQVAGDAGAGYALYELIWKRTVASQMTDATGSTATRQVAGTPCPTAALPSSVPAAR